MNNRSGIISLLAVGVLFGVSGSLAKYLGEWLNAYQVVLLRFAVALVVAIILLIVLGKKFNLKQVNKLHLVFYAITFPLSVIFFTLSVLNTKISIGVFSFYIASLVFSFILGKLVFQEKIGRYKIASLIVIFLALICFTNPFENFTINIGLIFGLLSGITQALASQSQRTISKGIDRLNLVIIQTCAGVILALIAMAFTNTLTIPSLTPIAIGISIIYGIIFLLIAYLMLYGFQKVNIGLGSLLFSTELIFSPIFAYLIFSEMPTGLEFVGGILTIIAVVLANLKD